MVRKLEQRPTRVRGALDRFGPPMGNGGIIFNGAEDEDSAYPQLSLEFEPSYLGQESA